jgi:hypothetical protein
MLYAVRADVIVLPEFAGEQEVTPQELAQMVADVHSSLESGE